MTQARYRLVALHGFLGAASDWDTFRALCPEGRWETLDLWHVFDTRVTDWRSLGEALSAQLRSAIGNDPLPAFLVGYSLGARLALALPWLGDPGAPFAGACLVSCHPGLPEEDERARTERVAADEAWARTFVDAPVARIWKEWDAQPVFASSGSRRREPALPAPRVTLARAMRVASLGRQPDRRLSLRAWKTPLLWVTGERDAKFRAVAASLASESVPARFVTLEHAGHRAPWDNPAAFARVLSGWVEETLAK